MMTWIACPKCGVRSYNPNDVKMRYCGNCHQFIEFLDEDSGLPPRSLEDDEVPPVDDQG